MRLELQSDAGDAQIIAGDGNLSVYDASTNTVYKAQIGTHTDTAGANTSHGVPTVAQISSALTELAQQATLSGAQPTTQAGQPAYQLSVTPKHDAGLLGEAQIAGMRRAACRSTSRSRRPAAALPCWPWT